MPWGLAWHSGELSAPNLDVTPMGSLQQQASSVSKPRNTKDRPCRLIQGSTGIVDIILDQPYSLDMDLTGRVDTDTGLVTLTIEDRDFDLDANEERFTRPAGQEQEGWLLF